MITSRVLSFENGPRKTRLLAYSSVFCISFTYAIVNAVILGRPERQVAIETSVITAVMMSLAPLVFASRPAASRDRLARTRQELAFPFLLPSSTRRAWFSYALSLVAHLLALIAIVVPLAIQPSETYAPRASLPSIRLVPLVPPPPPAIEEPSTGVPGRSSLAPPNVDSGLPSSGLPVREINLHVSPLHPSPGQDYSVIAGVVPPRSGVQVYILVRGTDGFRRELMGVTDPAGRFVASFPGGGEGVTDIVVSRTRQRGSSLESRGRIVFHRSAKGR